MATQEAIAVLVLLSVLIIFNVFKEIEESFPNLKLLGYMLTTFIALAGLHLANTFVLGVDASISNAVEIIFVSYSTWTIFFVLSTFILLGSWIVSRLKSPIEELKFQNNKR